MTEKWIAYKVICLINVIDSVEILYSFLPFTFSIIISVHSTHTNVGSIINKKFSTNKNLEKLEVDHEEGAAKSKFWFKGTYS